MIVLPSLIGGLRGGGRAPYLGQFATRSDAPTAYNTTNKQMRSRSAHIARSSVSSLKLGFPNWCVGGASSPGGANWVQAAVTGTVTLYASVEYPFGTFTRVTFGGVDHGSMDGGASGTPLTLLSDDISVSIPAGATFWVRTFWSNTFGIVFVDGSGDNAEAIQDNTNFGEVLDAAASGLTDNTLGGSYGTNIAGTRYGPALLLATITKPSILMIGDSRMHGAYDTADTTGDIGNVARSIGPSYGYTRIALGGYRASHFVSSHDASDTLGSSYFSHVICELGINDLYQGATSATVLSSLQSIWALYGTLNVGQTTLEPISASTDSWATTANQTTDTSNSNRTALNDALRGSPSGLNTLFEVADTVESGRNSGKWKVDGTADKWTGDGIHPSPYGYQQVQAANLFSSIS